MTPAGARQHLSSSKRQAWWTARTNAKGGAAKEILAAGAARSRRFPDRHSDPTLDLLQSMRDVFGDDGREADRAPRTCERCQLPQIRGEQGSLLQKLTELRISKPRGLHGERGQGRPGSFLLVENHCPICAAATACQGLCRSELAVFRAVLGTDITVERIDHILAGARRCAYRITRQR